MRQIIALSFLLLCCVFTTVYGQSDFDERNLMIAFEPGTTPQERNAIRQEYDPALFEYLPKLNIEIWTFNQFPVIVPDGGGGNIFLNDIIEVQGHATRKAKVTGGGLDYVVQYPENDLDDCNVQTGNPYDPLPCCSSANTRCGIDQNKVKIGIIDTGADLLQPQPFYPPYQIPTLGYDFVNNTPMPIDSNGHGTQMTSIIGGILYAQNADSVEISPLKSLGSDGTGSLIDIVRAIHFAMCDSLNILNLSLGYETVKTDAFDTFLKVVLQKAIDYNILIIVAAGNLGECIGDFNPYYPAAYELEGMLTIGASECTAGYAPFSNYGKSIDLLAPGVKVFCRDTAFGNWIYANGTSHAAAIATGMAAALATQQATFNASAIEEILLLELNSCVSNTLDADIPCHPNFTPVPNLVLPFIPPIDNIYSAGDTICSTAVVVASTQVTYKAGETILLKPGFHAQYGSCFTALIFECAPYTPSPNAPLAQKALSDDVPSTAIQFSEGQLYQNYPNPFIGETNIPYFIPESAKTASLQIVNHTGKKISYIDIPAKGNGQLSLQNGELPQGLYFYTLYIDGKIVRTRKMLLNDWN